jgi:ABC-type uncharacterized transport system permease subunit
MLSTVLSPTSGQMVLLVLAALLFALGTGFSLLRLRGEERWQRRAAILSWCAGIVLGLGVLLWHAAERGDWIPLGDNFDALVWLGLLLAGLMLYVQRRSPLGGLDWFIMPVVVLLLVGAMVMGGRHEHFYTDNAWSAVHRVMTFGGSLAFFIAGAAGALYLINNWRLRRKLLPAAGIRLGSLERQESLVNAAVTIGFGLMSVGLVTGLIWLVYLHKMPANRLWSHTKFVLGACVWLIYALALHTPLTVRLRGRRAAILSIVGAVLTLGALLAAALGSGEIK